MLRRDVLRLGGTALLGSLALPAWTRSLTSASSEAAGPLFFDPANLDRIRAAATSPLLAPTYADWAEDSPDVLREAVAQAVATGEILRDLRQALEALTRASIVQLIDPTPDRQAAMLEAVAVLVDRPKWDYFYDGPGEDTVIGIMRASLATVRLLLAREVLGDAIPPELDARLLAAVAEKGCLPCFNTIDGMNRPETVAGWRFDDQHASTYAIDMRRWPEILGANNLRAIPTMGLGLGALALRGHDPRADEWLATAEDSALRFLATFSPDGSYFEGVSYVDYALRTLLAFLDAHARLAGTVDWTKAANWDGIVDFILTMQAGVTDSGQPDVVNISDARRSVYPCIPAWIGQTTGTPLAQWTAEHVSEPGYYLDFLWYRPDQPAAPPPDRLKNVRTALDWVVCRTGWEAGDAVLSFRSGGPANHEHADRNSLLFKIHGERLLTDHHGAAYDWRQPGWLLRLTQAHNAVLIDGRGHQYHNGEEGTNESQAAARIVAYEADGDRVWWSSDATQAYRLVDPNVVSVVRTVAYAKPGVIVVFDTVRTSAPATVDVRFHPDNRDGAAVLATEGAMFMIERPRAVLHGRTFAQAPLTVEMRRLDLPAEAGAYPFVEAHASEAIDHAIVTVLAAGPVGMAAPPLEARAEADGWRFAAGDVRGRLVTTGATPSVRWG